MNYCRQDVIINTEIKDDKTIREKCAPILDFANKHGVYFNIGLDIQGKLMATYETEGITSAYCKGVIAEIKQMLKDIFKCKIDTTFYAY